MERAEALKHAHEAIKNAPISILITNGLDGYPAARPMGTLAVEDDFTVYYATGAPMEKCTQLKADPKAAVYWPNLGEGGHGWVMLKGEAELTTAPELLDRFWREEFTRYFPQGRRDPGYVIIRVTPKTLTVLVGDMDSRPVTVSLG
jgi:general stress protein 26